MSLVGHRTIMDVRDRDGVKKSSLFISTWAGTCPSQNVSPKTGKYFSGKYHVNVGRFRENTT